MSINFPDSPSNGDTTILGGKTYTYDSTSTSWTPSSAPAAAGTTVVANLSALLALTGMSDADMAFVTDTKAIYVWDGTEWDRIYSGPQEMVEWSTASNSSYNLIIGDSSTTISPVATDPDGFGITYDYLTNPSNPDIHLHSNLQ